MIVFGGWAFGRRLGHEGETIINMMSFLIEDALPLCEDRVKRWSPVNQKVAPHETLDLLVL